ncbi:multidrug resistance-associated ABC transporter [Mycena latifolia]|nr:multidrug resistance-associated ABC transporter [Mycena latifolia]
MVPVIAKDMGDDDDEDDDAMSALRTVNGWNLTARAVRAARADLASRTWLEWARADSRGSSGRERTHAARAARVGLGWLEYTVAPAARSSRSSPRLERLGWRTGLNLGGSSEAKLDSSNFASPIAMNQLLQYIEKREQGGVIRPWVWIVLLFLGPVLGTVDAPVALNDSYRTLERCTIAPKLTFASLRIRLNTEATAAKESSRGHNARSENESVTTQAGTANIKSPAKRQAAKPEGRLVGKINNLVTTDLANIGGSRGFLVLLIYVPLQLSVGIWFLHALLGWAVWVGLGSIILLTPVPGLSNRECPQNASLFLSSQCPSPMEHNNTVSVFLSSNFITGSLEAKTLIMGKALNASKVFSTMTVFDLLSDSISEMTWWLSRLATGKVSLDRVNDFLKNSELLDEFEGGVAPVPFSDERIGFRNATFSWYKETEGSNQQVFKLKIDGEVIFQRGQINLVVGPTGSGKTSLLMALLGEMHWLPISPDSWYNLPRSSGVAYAAQESWVLNETIRDNIIFDTPFEEERYKQVLHQCALEPDLALLQAGDKTEVGEKGLTLSGGQKARLTLARAVYSKTNILLLDDVLAALDVHTAQWIVEKCFGGDLVKNRTVILVTHNVALTRPIAHFVITLGSAGKVDSYGTVAEIVQRDAKLASQIREDDQVLKKAQQEIDTKAPIATPADGKLIVAEEIKEGRVHASAMKMYVAAMAGQYPLFFFIFFSGGSVFAQVFVVLKTWMLGYWAQQYDYHPADEVNVAYYLSIFVAVVATSTAAHATMFIFLVLGQLRASKVIHKSLVDSVLTAPLRWLDVTPTSRIITRVTTDVRAVDDSLGNRFWALATLIVAMMGKLGAVVIYTPVFFVPGILVGALGAWIGQIYMAGQLPVKRLMSNTRAPVLAHVGAAIAGLVSIRAFGAESKFCAESMTRIDRYTRAARSFYNLSRWVSVRIDLLGSLFSAGLAMYLVYVKHTSAGNSGFLINMAVTFTARLLTAVRVLNDFEVQANSLERIQGYIEIEHEKAATERGKPPAYWPATGDLRVEHLFARYSDHGPDVLHDVSFHIKSGERVGIVGRTGSGKSSLTLSLLRCIPTEGSVVYSGVQTSDLNLDALRSSITIIPQVPEMLSGSLRANLDPFSEHDDVELNYALRAAGLFALQSEMDQGRITLDSSISAGGSNLSVGQRQILALARAILRKSKLLILDEATSAIGKAVAPSVLEMFIQPLDCKTDSIIQDSLRQELPDDVSLIIVAHRLQTIMDADKIMVLDAGHLVEFGSPRELLKMQQGKFRSLVDESSDRDELHAIARAN